MLVAWQLDHLESGQSGDLCESRFPNVVQKLYNQDNASARFASDDCQAVLTIEDFEADSK
jgi:hypothetical protein